MPIEIEKIVAGLAKGSKLVGGADIFIVDPLPQPPQFELRGYSQCTADVTTNPPEYIPTPRILIAESLTGCDTGKTPPQADLLPVHRRKVATGSASMWLHWRHVACTYHPEQSRNWWGGSRRLGTIRGRHSPAT